MKLLSGYIGEDLILIQPSFFKREFEFRSSDELLAKMYYPKFFSQTAVVEGFNNKYEIFRPNFWRSEIGIRNFGNELSVASLTTNFFRARGKLSLQNGKFVNLKFGMFKKLCEMFSESGELLIEINFKFSFKDKHILTIHKTSSVIDENPWIIMMVWYFLIENKRNAAGS